MTRQGWEYCLLLVTEYALVLKFFGAPEAHRVHLLEKMVATKKKTQYEPVTFSGEKDTLSVLNHPFYWLIGLLGAHGWEIVQVDCGSGPGKAATIAHWRCSYADKEHDYSWVLFKRQIVDGEAPVPPSLGDSYRWRKVESLDELWSRA